MNKDTESLFEPYDVLAVEVLGNHTKNTDVSLSYTNQELAEHICQAMGWEDFDLFEHHDFPEVALSDDPAVCLSYAFLSFLRWRVFTTASARSIGVEAFNQKAAAYSEFWYISLVERWNNMAGASAPMKPWLQ